MFSLYLTKMGVFGGFSLYYSKREKAIHKREGAPNARGWRTVRTLPDTTTSGKPALPATIPPSAHKGPTSRTFTL